MLCVSLSKISSPPALTSQLNILSKQDVSCGTATFRTHTAYLKYVFHWELKTSIPTNIQQYQLQPLDSKRSIYRVISIHCPIWELFLDQVKIISWLYLWAFPNITMTCVSVFRKTKKAWLPQLPSDVQHGF